MFLPLLLVALQEGEETVLADTVISAPRTLETVTSTPAKHVVVTGERLVETGERSLPRAIGRTTGVWIQETNLGGGAPVIRGLLGNKILIVVDGVRLNDSTTRFGPNQSLNSIDPFTVDRIEVIRGSRSLLFGSDAIGGVILVWTKRRQPLGRDPDPEAKSWGVGFEGLGNTATGLQGSLNGSFATEKHGLLAIGSARDFHDLETGGGATVPNTGYSGYDLFGAWEWGIAAGKTLRTTGRVHRDLDVPRTDKMNTGFGQTEPTHAQWFYRLQDRRVAQVTYDDVSDHGLIDQYQVRLSLRTYEERRDIQRTGSSTLVQEQDEVTTIGVGMDWREQLGEGHLLTWGLDVDHDDVASVRRDTDLNTGNGMQLNGAFAPGARYTRTGVFFQDEVLALDPWFMTVGLRYSYYDFSFRDRVDDSTVSGDFDALVASVEAAREVGQGYTFTGSLAQGYRAPNLDDLANDGSFAGGIELGNPELDPEKSLMGELTFAAERALWGGTLAGFYTHIEDFIGRILLDEGDPGSTGDELYLRANSGTADIWGVEGTFRIKLITKDSPFNFLTRAAFVRGQQFDPAVDPATGEMPQYDVPFRRIPPFHGRAAVRYDGQRPWNHIDWAEVYLLWADDQNRLHPQDVTDPRIDPGGSPGWATLNFEFGGPIAAQDARWWVGVHNLLDKRYRVHASGFDAPGTALILGVSAQF